MTCFIIYTLFWKFQLKNTKAWKKSQNTPFTKALDLQNTSVPRWLTKATSPSESWHKDTDLNSDTHQCLMQSKEYNLILRILVKTPQYKYRNFQIGNEERFLVAQLAGGCFEDLLKAGKMLQKDIVAIDLNLGCPQGIARKGNYGWFLLEQEDKVM